MTVAPACPACHRLIGPTFSCVAEEREDVTRFGEEIQGQAVAPGSRCHDCNVVEGGCHHVWCAVPWCLTCDEQRLTCGCDDEPALL